MSRPDLPPTPVQIQHARRLMAHAQIRDVRLLQARVRYGPPAKPAAKTASGFEIDIATNTQGKLTHDGKLKIVVSSSLKARRARSRKAEVEVEASFQLLYALPEELKPTQREIRAFADSNAMLNSWPYWREFVQNTVSRMNLPPLVLPLFRLSPPGAAKPSTPEASPKARMAASASK